MELFSLPGLLSSLVVLQVAAISLVALLFLFIERMYYLQYGEKSKAIRFMSIASTLNASLVIFPLMKMSDIDVKLALEQYELLIISELILSVLFVHGYIKLVSNPKPILDFLKRRDPVFFAIFLFSLITIIGTINLIRI